MEFIQSYTRFIEEHLSNHQLPQQPTNLYEPIRYFLRIGGKRMRPMLTLLGAELFGLHRENAIQAALAIEVFHNFTLVHDDIMDKAPLRRGMQTVHEKWDGNTAILAGDVMMIEAYQLLLQQEGDLRAMLKVFNKTAIEVCEGQQMDMDFEQQNNLTIPEYIEMIRLKTSVLLGGALELAAIIAGATEEDRKQIYQFGVNVGLAFQIQDDILDVYADPEKFGKQVGGDILSNKKTMLYLLAREAASDEQLQQLNQLLTEENSSTKIAKTIQIYNDLKVREKCQQYVDDYFSKALANINSVGVVDNQKTKLKELSNFLLFREH
jgi:geranylgeranyl diphosphate synthase, type II